MKLIPYATLKPGPNSLLKTNDSAPMIHAATMTLRASHLEVRATVSRAASSPQTARGAE
jgi:hypothetical protein